MIEDTRGYREMMRITHDGFLELPRLMEPDITPRPLWKCQVLLASYRFVCFSLANKLENQGLCGKSFQMQVEFIAF